MNRKNFIIPFFHGRIGLHKTYIPYAMFKRIIMEQKEKIQAGDRCIHCQSTNTIVETETDYDDGTDEPTTGNHLITYEFLFCNDCKQ